MSEAMFRRTIGGGLQTQDTKSYRRLACAITAFVGTAVLCVGARADLAPWMQYIVASSGIEGALYRVMEMPGVRTLYPRPPAEAREELSKLLGQKPDANLYALRAHVEEQGLNFTAAASAAPTSGPMIGTHA